MSNDLSRWTSFGIGGRAKRLTVVRSRGELIDGACRGLVLGRGTNVLVSDSGYGGTVVINRYATVLSFGETVTAGSGAALSFLSLYAAELSLSGLEWATGIPGSVGGAVKMNAGAYGGCIGDVLLYADVLRGGKIIRLSPDGLGLSYRHSELGEFDTVIDATFMLKHRDGTDIKRECGRLRALRASKMPVGRSAGSVFKNPNGISIARELEAAGLKGMRSGGAMFSPKHANVIVNTGGATAADVVALITSAKTALQARGITAEEEIIYIGDF